MPLFAKKKESLQMYIKLKTSRDHFGLSKWSLSPVSVLTRSRKGEDMDKTRWKQRQRLDHCGHGPRSTRSPQKPEKLGRMEGRPLAPPRAFRGSTVL